MVLLLCCSAGTPWVCQQPAVALCRQLQLCSLVTLGMQRLSPIRDPAALLLKDFFQPEVFYTVSQLSVLLTQVTCRLPGQSFPVIVQSSFKKTKKLLHLRKKKAWPGLVKDRNTGMRLLSPPDRTHHTAPQMGVTLAWDGVEHGQGRTVGQDQEEIGGRNSCF